MNIADLSIAKIQTGLAKKEFSALEIAKEAITFAKKADERVRAFLSWTEEEALHRGALVDERISRGKNISALAGVPFAVKDNILVENHSATAGSKILKNYRASYDATVIKKLKADGVLFIGKTNLDEFAMGASTENSAFHATHNPRDVSRVPGGSSGGSAAAVAAGMVVCALGSDTGGSVRQPASFCGVVGLRPTYGTVSRSGLIAMASSLDQIGPIGRSVEDVAYLYEAIAGHDALDATSHAYEHYEVVSALSRPLTGMRIGMPKEYFIEGLDPNIKSLIEGAAKTFERLGATIQEVSLPHTTYALATYYVLVPSEASANLARFDGIRYGLSEQGGADVWSVYTRTKAQGFGPEPKRRIILGTFALSAGYYDAYYRKAQKVRAKIKEDFERAFKTVDILLSPTTPTTAFKLGEKLHDPLSMYLADVFTAPQPLAGIPALSMPVGEIDGLPVGMQLMAPQFGEAKILNAGYAYEKFAK